MRYSLFQIEREKPMTLQAQIREMLVAAMLADQLPPNTPVPSTRAMAKRLKVSRNTVMLAYQALASDGYLIARERSGFYVSEEARASVVGKAKGVLAPAPHKSAINWSDRVRLTPSRQNNITKPENWYDYPYPFIYGQVDHKLFPITAWRDCMRQSMNIKWLDAWTNDRFAADDPMLVEQIQQRILMRRGILAKPEEILITMGAQNALFLLSQLLVDRHTTVAIEDPGYPDLRNMLALNTEQLRFMCVDREGLVVNALNDEKVVFVTPSHQFPTNVTMSMERRIALLQWAKDADAILIEDDYEFETNYRSEPTPALKSLDTEGRVVHVGSLSKSLMPGLRMGFVVADPDLIFELRALRRLMLRHPPGNNQRVVALFLALGGHDALVNRLHQAYAKRWETMVIGLDLYFPGYSTLPAFGGTSFWCQGPKDLDACVLAERALEKGVVIESGDVFFANPDENRNCFRLGFSSIDDARIKPGLELLAKAMP